MFTSAILADGQEWADTEGGILRSCAAYCLDRFQRYQKSRLEIKFNALFFYNTIISIITLFVCCHVRMQNLWSPGGSP